MTLIPETNREDGPCVVWVGSTIHGLDTVYGPFPNVATATAWAKKESNTDGSHPGMTCSDYLILMLDQSLMKADIILQSGVPTYDNVSELTKAMFPHGWSSDDNEQNELVIHTGLRISENPDVEDGVLERVWDDNDNEIPVPEEWYEEEDASPPIVTLDLKSAVGACLDIANEVFPGGKLAVAEADQGPKDDIEMFLEEIETTPLHDKSVRYSDDVRLATWAALMESGQAKELDNITEQDMDAWWKRFDK